MFMKFFTKDMGIDLGTANTLIYVKGKGILIDEPSVIAMDKYTKKILAVGKEAKEMLGKAPNTISVIRPLQDGVISDFEMTAAMLREFVKKVMTENSMFTRVRIVVGVPAGVTEVEKRAVEEVIRQLGAKDVFILDEPMAAAIGAGMNVDGPEGCMIADIGGGTADIAIISLGGIVTSVSLRHAGDKLNEAIVAYMRKTYNLLIGEGTAEQIKVKIACVYNDEENPEDIEYMDAKGRDLVTGLPKVVNISSLDVMKALEESIWVIIDGIKSTLEQAPPEISADIVTNGMVLSGGGALIKGLDKLIEANTGMKVIIAENALEAVAQGTGMSLASIENIHKYVRAKVNYYR
ncbi:rod shape-determining protein [Anaerovorax odorimutans]|uniref:rod shape-determining protein n=1 Tax=Anaerovorax odorimutans TaxID=109327 RepID=UPI0004036386|nr:rod shape-determining protein [Anaerovorax odorimutans]